MSLVYSESPESCLILCQGYKKNPWKMPFSDFHGASEICLSLNKIQIIIR